MLRILAFSDYRVQDLDRLLRYIREKGTAYDAIVYAGDDVRRFAEGSRNYFEEIGKLSEHGVLAVVGNDDTRDCKGVLKGKHVHDLHEEPYTIEEYGFLGQEGTTSDIGYILYSEDQVQNHLKNQIETVGDRNWLVLISHQPPYRVLDFAQRFGTKHIGSKSIREILEKYKIKLNICGHVHMYGGRSEKLGDASVVNIASGDEPRALARIADISIPRKNTRLTAESAINRPSISFSTIEESEIRDLRDVGDVRSKKLIDSGFTSLQKIANEDLVDIIEKTGIYPKITWKLWLSAKAITENEIFQLDDFAFPKDPIYLDVETTPQIRFMTGVYYPKEEEFKQFTVKKWTAGGRRRTKRALQRYLESKGKSLVTYTSYDTRFLTSKMLRSKNHYDLYNRLRESFVLPTQDYKLSRVGGIFGYKWEDPGLTGGDMPRLYSDYRRTGWKSYLKKIEEHNKDDVMAMWHIIQEIENSEFDRKISTEKSLLTLE